MNTVTPSPATSHDRIRQVLVVVGSVLAFVVAAWGSGAFGGPGMAEVADGAFAPDASVLAPASTAFSIWSLIYVGLAVFMIYQALPSRGGDARLRAVGWWVLGSAALNALWITAARAGLLWVTVAIIVVLLAVLARIALILVASPPSSWRDIVTTDVPVGLYLGWVVVATAANVAAAIADAQAGQSLTSPAWVVGAIATVVVVVAIIIVIARRARTRPGVSIAAGLATTWGLIWIAVARAEGEPESLVLMWAAGLAACLTFAVPPAIRDFSQGDQGPPGSWRQRAA